MTPFPVAARSLTVWGLFVACAALSGCREKAQVNEREQFFKLKDAANNGDYLATYPLTNADSCIARLKAEVPEPFQAWAALSIYYHLPRTAPAKSFRFLELYEKNYPHDTVRAFAQISRAEFLVDLAQFDSAQTCLDDAEAIYARLERPLDRSDIKHLRARARLFQNDFAGALNNYFDALALLNIVDTSFSDRRSSLHHDIAIVYERSQDYYKMLNWGKKTWAADHSKLASPLNFKAQIASLIGMAYRETDADSAIYWTKKAVDIYQNQLKHPATPRLNLRHGRALLEKKDFSAALPHFLEGYRKRANKQETFAYYQYSLALGECYLRLGKLDSAQFFLQESLASPDTGSLSKARTLLGEFYGIRGNWKRALEEAKEGARLNGIKFTADKKKAVANFEAQMAASEKVRSIAELESRHRDFQQKSLIAVLLSLLAAGFGTSLFFRQRARRRLLEKENLNVLQEKQLVEARERLQAMELVRSKSELLVSNSALKSTEQALETSNQLLAVKNKLITDLNMRLTNPLPTGDNGAGNLRSMKILTEVDWVDFQEHFDHYFPGLLMAIRGRFQGLTSAEVRLFLLIKLGFHKKEMAEALGIAQESIWRSRHRLGKKLGLSETVDLDIFIRQFSG